MKVSPSHGHAMPMAMTIPMTIAHFYGHMRLVAVHSYSYCHVRLVGMHSCATMPMAVAIAMAMAHLYGHGPLLWSWPIFVTIVMAPDAHAHAHAHRPFFDLFF